MKRLYTTGNEVYLYETEPVVYISQNYLVDMHQTESTPSIQWQEIADHKEHAFGEVE